MRIAHIIALVLIIVGAVSWGLVGAAGFDLIAQIFGLQFGSINVITRIIYILVGLAGLYEIIYQISHRSAAHAPATPA